MNMGKNNFIKSPMNYTGGKHKLLPQLWPILSQKINSGSRFIDLFAGGCNVAVNVRCKKVIANDYEPHIMELYRTWQSMSIEDILSYIKHRIDEFGLSKTNKEGFYALREKYNAEPSPLDLFVLICYSFNNQFRFNKDGGFNMPFGLNRSSFNSSIEKNLINFHAAIKDIVFVNKDFRDLKLDKLGPDDLVYCDPPYLITCATYNENDGWNEGCEKDLLSLLDNIHVSGANFALSNVLFNKGKTNDILIDWVEKNHAVYRTIHLDNTYSNCNYHTKDKSGKADEVLIVNW